MVRPSITTLLTADDQNPKPPVVSDRPSRTPRRGRGTCAIERRRGDGLRRSRRRRRASGGVAPRTGGRSRRARRKLEREDKGALPAAARSDERRGGKECVRTSRSGWWAYH